MQTFKVNKDSWHYSILDWYGVERIPKDFCSYWRYVLLYVLLTIVTVFGLLASIAGVITVFILYPVDFLAILGITVAIIVLPIVISGVVSAIVLDMHKSNKPDSIFYTRYKSWKQRYCPSIEYEE